MKINSTTNTVHSDKSSPPLPSMEDLCARFPNAQPLAMDPCVLKEILVAGDGPLPPLGATCKGVKLSKWGFCVRVFIVFIIMTN